MLISKRKLNVLFIFFIIVFGLFTSNAQAKTDDSLVAGKVDAYSSDTVAVIDSTDTNSLNFYAASVAPISEFFDSKGNFNTIYETDESITLIKYNKDFTVSASYTIDKPYSQFGGAICDSKGNYYIVYGENNITNDESLVVLSVVKYNSDLKYQAEIKYTGAETGPYSGAGWGTKIPFQSGNCDIALNGNILVFTYARKMYNQHQSNHVIYLDYTNMTKLDYAGCYTSHSFDQRVIVTSDGNYLFADHGDAFDRGFKLSKVLNYSTDIWDTKDYVSFHFREGANRDYGYNETYAQLGGIAEINTGYVLAGASEKTLSLKPAPTNRGYCGYSESRNLFIQILDKNFAYLSGASTQVLKSEVRSTTGTSPSNAMTELFLTGDEKDYGILWLTNYSDEFCVVNPKLITTDDDRIVLLWEKFKYETEDDYEKYVDTYYMILSSDGTVLQKAISLHGVRLTANETPVYRDQKVYWSTSDGKNAKLKLNILHLDETITLTDISSLSVDKIANQKLSIDDITPDVVIKNNKKRLVKGIDYTLEYQYNYKPGKAIITITGIGSYYGTRDISFYIASENVLFKSLYSNTKGSFNYKVDSDGWYYCDGIQVEYSADSKFTTKKTLNKSSGKVSKLKSKTTYYIRARSYIEVDGKRIYGSYCKVQKVKVK